MAKRLIDAKALMEHIKDLPTWWPDEGGYYMESMKYPQGMFEPDDIISSIDNAPTVDAVEVVRCKDCKHYVFPEDGDFLGECKNGRLAVSQSGEIYPEENYYCAYGERRNDGKKAD